MVMAGLSEPFKEVIQHLDLGKVLLDQDINFALSIQEDQVLNDTDRDWLIQLAMDKKILFDMDMTNNITCDAWSSVFITILYNTFKQAIQNISATGTCTKRTGFIKDNCRYYIIDAGYELKADVEEFMFSDKVMASMPCAFSKQPFLFALTQTEVSEYQFFSKKAVPLVEFSIDNGTIVNYSNTKFTSILERRSDFNGQTVIAIVDFFLPHSFILLGNQTYTGFHGEYVTILQNKLNIQFIFQSDMTFGVKQADGTWSGRIGKLVNNSIDAGL